MLVYIILSVLVSACVAGVPSTERIVCGPVPITMGSCVDYRKVMNDPSKRDRVKHCTNSASECDTMTCMFRSLGWLEDGKLNKRELIDNFEKIANDYPEWSTAVQHVKADCFAFDLPAQGIELNCPAFDVMLCAARSFVKHAPASKWSTSTECQRVKQFAEVCPWCPDECFASSVPLGACNACIGLPRSP